MCHESDARKNIIGVWEIHSSWIFSLFCHFHLKGHSWLPVCIWDTGGAANYSGSTTMQGHSVVKRCKCFSLPSFFSCPLPPLFTTNSSSFFLFLHFTTNSFLLLSMVSFGVIETSKLQLTLFKHFQILDRLSAWRIQFQFSLTLGMFFSSGLQPVCLLPDCPEWHCGGLRRADAALSRPQLPLGSTHRYSNKTHLN